MSFDIGALVARTNQVAAGLAAPLFEGHMSATIRITRGGDQAPGWDPATGKVVPGDEDEIYGPDRVPEGKSPIAMIKTVSGPVTMALADEPQYFQSTFIEIPLWARQPETDDLVEVLTAPDARLVGRFYRIVDVEHAGELPLYQRLQVVGIQPGRSWRAET